jgi:hypothetical protein
LKNGPQVFKTASLLYFGKSPGDISKVELRFKTSKREGAGRFRTERQWAIDGDEVSGLQRFLEADLGESGHFRVVAGGASAAQVLDYLADGELSSGFLASMARTIADRVEIVSSLSDVEGAELVGQAVDLRRQRLVTDQFEAVVLDPTSLERDLNRELDGNWWLLGANYIGKVDRKRFTVLDQYDLALVRADNVLHIIELKRAAIPDLVYPHRSHFAVGDEVNEAVNQAMNYLRTLDENRYMIGSEFGVECRRVQATVIVGHPDHNENDEVSEAELREAIRTYNAHLSRIEVLTYQDVLDTARNSMKALARQIEEESVYIEIDTDDRPLATDPDEEPF